MAWQFCDVCMKGDNEEFLMQCDGDNEELGISCDVDRYPVLPYPADRHSDTDPKAHLLREAQTTRQGPRGRLVLLSQV